MFRRFAVFGLLGAGVAYLSTHHGVPREVSYVGILLLDAVMGR